MIDPELLKNLPMFQSLGPAELEPLAAVMSDETVPGGKHLFEVGDPGTSMYVVKRGMVRVSVSSGLEELELARFGPGEFFGELALLDGQARSARATTTEETELYILSRERFLEFIRSRPLTALSMLASIGKRLRQTTELMRTRTTLNLNEEIRKHETLADRVSDRIAEFGGSWRFIFFYCGLVVLWMVLNTLGRFGLPPFDEPPYQGLNLVLGIIATLQAPFIMMSQNRDQARERLRSEADYKVNLKNEIGVEKTVAGLEQMKHDLAELKQALLQPRL